MKEITTFPNADEYAKARERLHSLGIPYDVIQPEPGYAKSGVPALILDAENRMKLSSLQPQPFISSGWVDYVPPRQTVPSSPPREFAEDLFGTIAIMVLAPCVADAVKIRLIAHTSRDLAPVFPYLNNEMRAAAYNPHSQTVTFMEQHRMISLYPRRITIAKLDDMVDAWRVLDLVRTRINEIWARRHLITPNHEMRRKPAALEFYQRLPKINCQVCGEKTCMAFAFKLWNQQADPTQCKPVFEGHHAHLQEPLLEICAGFGLTAPPADE